MKVIEIIPKNFYTCQFCRKEFESSTEQRIIPEVNPFCSYRCQFNIIYNLLKKCSKDKIQELVKKYNLLVPENKVIFQLTKILIKVSSVNSVSSFMLSEQSEHISKTGGTITKKSTLM